MPSFGENLRTLRLSRGYSQDKFAKIINSNQVNVSAWELGTRTPGFSTIRHIADTFKVPVTSLMSVSETGLDDDYVRQVADTLQTNPKIRQLFDRAQYLSDYDLNVLLTVATALSKDRADDV